jgi:hypothetical protein
MEPFETVQTTSTSPSSSAAMDAPIYHPQPSAYLAPQSFGFSYEAPNISPPPPLQNADLFSASEETELLGFFDSINFDFETEHFQPQQPHQPHQQLQQHYSLSSAAHSEMSASNLYMPMPLSLDTSSIPTTHAPYDMSSSSSNLAIRSSPHGRVARTASISPMQTPTDGGESKPLLSTPQKRLNHIMSEQKRRNAIREGYAQLIGLLAPAGSQCAIAMPSRGRPKGSGNRNKNKTQGKSGVLFRAVEYIQFLEQGRDALREEVERLENMAGIAPPHAIAAH